MHLPITQGEKKFKTVIVHIVKTNNTVCFTCWNYPDVAKARLSSNLAAFSDEDNELTKESAPSAKGVIKVNIKNQRNHLGKKQD